jgi:hypothetical protein
LAVWLLALCAAFKQAIANFATNDRQIVQSTCNREDHVAKANLKRGGSALGTIRYPPCKNSSI